jgi:excisionase family DNA binding protein
MYNATMESDKRLIKDWWTTTELAAYASVDQSYIRRLVRNEKIKGVRKGSFWLIPDYEARRWLSSRKRR